MGIRVVGPSANMRAIRATWNRPPDHVGATMRAEPFRPSGSDYVEPGDAGRARRTVHPTMPRSSERGSCSLNSPGASDCGCESNGCTADCGCAECGAMAGRPDTSSSVVGGPSVERALRPGPLDSPAFPEPPPDVLLRGGRGGGGGSGFGPGFPEVGDFWGIAPDGSWVFWEGPEIGWWDLVPGPWGPDVLDIPGPGPGGGDDTPDPGLPTLVLSDCPPLPFAPRFTKPDLTSLNSSTQDCFEDPPFHDYCTDPCCPPPVNAQSCTLPSFVDVLQAGTLITVRPVGPDFPFSFTPAAGVPTPDDLALLGSALALLQANIDIVEWIVCMVEWYSPDFDYYLSACVPDFLDGSRPLHFTFVGTMGGGTAGAFTEDAPASDGSVGIIIEATGGYWNDLLTSFVSGGADAFCAVVAAATMLLHEMVHICGDDGCSSNGGDGACHLSDCTDATPECWDEARMIDSAFQWAMAQRYPCVTTSGRACCANMGLTTNFMTSGCTAPWRC